MDGSVRNEGRRGTNILEPELSIDGFSSEGRSFPSRPGSRVNEKGDNNILLEPDFTVDYDIELPTIRNRQGPRGENNGIDIREPEFGIEGFDISWFRYW